jgi:hypothetical protein
MIGQGLLLELLLLTDYTTSGTMWAISRLAPTHHTSELACDSIPYWWNTYGKVPDHGANSILI